MRRRRTKEKKMGEGKKRRRWNEEKKEGQRGNGKQKGRFVWEYRGITLTLHILYIM